MFQRIELPDRHLQTYVRHSEPGIVEELLELANQLQDLRFVHTNSTAVGGGVAEVLRSLVPFMRSIGLQTEWFVLTPPDSFFRITKKIHNLLQGQEGSLLPEEMDTYLHYFHGAPDGLRDAGVSADFWLLHDPQLLPLALHIGQRPSQLNLWVCHIDLSSPNPQAFEKLAPLTSNFDALVFSKGSYVPSYLDSARVHIIPPAIDSSTVKNVPLPAKEAMAIVAQMGINPDRPLVAQVSRFDMWKDPWGVIDAYRIAKSEVPGLQLALLGYIQAKDDPEGREVLESVLHYVGDDPDIHLFWDPEGLEISIDQVVNAFQVASQVILQKSIREGFGLTVTEAMWKGTPVIGGNVGGIRDQIQDGVNGFLVENFDECGRRLIQLLREPLLLKEMGKRARESVQSRYLLPRLLRDYLRVIQAHLQPDHARTDSHARSLAQAFVSEGPPAGSPGQ